MSNLNVLSPEAKRLLIAEMSAAQHRMLNEAVELNNQISRLQREIEELQRERNRERGAADALKEAQERLALIETILEDQTGIHQDTISNIGALTKERDEARAQVARLAEVLRRSVDLANEAAKAEYMTTLSDNTDTGIASKGAIQRAKNAWRAYDDCVETALASTDARAWLNEQIAAELDQIDRTLIDTCRDSLSRDYQHGMRVAGATCRGRAAELRRKEGS